MTSEEPTPDKYDGIISELNALKQDRADLAMLVRRLCRQLAKTGISADALLVQGANEYLKRKNLQ